MEFVVNNSHKKIFINKEATPRKVNVQIKDSVIKIDVYSGCKSITNIDNFPIADKQLYEVEYDMVNNLYVMDDVEVDSFSAILNSVSNVSDNVIKYR